MGAPYLLLFLAISLITGPGDEPKVKMHTDREAMKKEVARHIPIGSEIDDADRIMTANGFKCIRRERTAFSENDVSKHVRRVESVDFLYCDKEKPAWLFCEHRWQIAIVHEKGVVSDILVSFGVTCP